MATQTQEVTQRLAPFQEKFLEDIFAQASALKGTGMPYAPQQLAGLSAEQQQAISQATAGVGAYQPYLQAAQQYAAPEGVSQFFNPYESQVVDQTMQDIGRAGQMQQQQLGAPSPTRLCTSTTGSAKRSAVASGSRSTGTADGCAGH